MQIILNGDPQTFTTPMTVSALLEHLQMDPLGVAVAINLHVVPRSQHENHTLQSGDRVDVIRAVGGG